MPLPTTTTASPYEAIRRSNAAAVQAVQRLARVTQQSFDEFWGGDRSSRIARAEVLNQFASDTGTSARDIFAEHLATAMMCIDRVPSTAPMFEAPPIDMASVYTEAGVIDIALFTAALDAISQAPE